MDKYYSLDTTLLSCRVCLLTRYFISFRFGHIVNIHVVCSCGCGFGWLDLVWPLFAVNTAGLDKFKYFCGKGECNVVELKIGKI